jgi:hypothetical protein
MPNVCRAVDGLLAWPPEWTSACQRSFERAFTQYFIVCCQRSIRMFVPDMHINNCRVQNSCVLGANLRLARPPTACIVLSIIPTSDRQPTDELAAFAACSCNQQSFPFYVLANDECCPPFRAVLLNRFPHADCDVQNSQRRSSRFVDDGRTAITRRNQASAPKAATATKWLRRRRADRRQPTTV